MDDQYKTEDYEVRGCQAKVWLHTEIVDGKLVFEADSDAIITKGIIGLLVHVLSDHEVDEILDTNLYFIDEIGIKYGHTIGLEWIVANPKVRNVGWGNQVLEIITSLADEYDFDIALHCCNGSEFKNTINKKHNFDKYLGADTGSMDNGRLTEWYGKHGFDLNPSNAGDYIKDGDKLNLEFLFRPSKLTKDFKFPTLFSKKVEGENVSFSYGNTLKHFKKLAMVA